MLILTRRKGESMVIFIPASGRLMEVLVIQLGITAPRNMQILRKTAAGW